MTFDGIVIRRLGKHAKQIFGKSWDFGPTGLTPPLPERWDFFRGFFGNFRQKRVKYAIKQCFINVGIGSDHAPPPWAKFPTFTENLF